MTPKTPETDREAADVLEAHNAWRRGGDGPATDPLALGRALDRAISLLRAQRPSAAATAAASYASPRVTPPSDAPQAAGCNELAIVECAACECLYDAVLANCPECSPTDPLAALPAKWREELDENDVAAAILGTADEDIGTLAEVLQCAGYSLGERLNFGLAMARSVLALAARAQDAATGRGRIGAEIAAAREDARLLGTGYMLDGQRIDPSRLTIIPGMSRLAAPAGVTEDWRKKAADWLESKAAEQEANNTRWPDHAAAYQSWRERPTLYRLLVQDVLTAALSPMEAKKGEDHA